jgi:hypothetical protein
MNNQRNLEEVASQSSVITDVNDDNRVNIDNLFDQIKDILVQSFDAITSDDEDLYLNLTNLIEQVRGFKDFFTDLELGFFLAIDFFLRCLRPNINNDLVALQFRQHEYDVSQQKLQVIHEQRVAKGKEISDHVIDESFNDDVIKNLEEELRILKHMEAIGQHADDDQVNNIEEALRTAYQERKCNLTRKESLTKDLMATIMEGHNERSEIESNWRRALEAYKGSHGIREEMIEGWTNLQLFCFM